MKDQKQTYGLIAKHFKEIRERIEKAELSDATCKHNLMGEMKDQNEKIVNVITGLIQKLQEEREEDTATETKKKGVCFICNDPGHYAPDCPNRKEKKGNQGGSYYQKGFQKGNQGGTTYNNQPTIAQRKQNSNCYHCGQAGHWASECPIKDIPAFDQEFWNDLENFAEPKKMQMDETQQPIQEEPEPIQVPQPVPQAPKKRKLSL